MQYTGFMSAFGPRQW